MKSLELKCFLRVLKIIENLTDLVQRGRYSFLPPFRPVQTSEVVLHKLTNLISGLTSGHVQDGIRSSKFCYLVTCLLILYALIG